MKKLLIATAAALACTPAFAETFQKGDMVVDLSIGVGAAQVTNTEYTKDNKINIDDKQSKATFTQKLGFEVGICNLSEKSAIGFGVNINNSTGATHNSIVSGSYDYSYKFEMYKKNSSVTGRRKGWELTQTDMIKRQGSGTAQAKTKIEDINVMVKFAYHHQFIKQLDTYCALGFGISAYTENYGDYSHETGFSKVDNSFEENYPSSYQGVYKYNDLEHVDWQGSAASARFVLGAYVGARYYFTKNLGVNAQIGLNSLSFKKDLNNFNIFDVGISYKF